MDEHVSHSQLSTFTTCSQKWAFRYLDGLRPRGLSSDPLRRGTLYHEGMNAAYMDWMRPGATIDRVVSAGAARVVEYGREHNAEHDDESIDLVCAMVRRSMQHILDAEFGRLVPVASELEFSLAIRGIRGIKMNGFIDAVMFSLTENVLFINEHKQTSNRVESVERRVAFDPQISTYVDALRAMLDSGRLSAALWPHGVEDARNVRVGPVVYNVARAAKPRVPRVLNDGTVSVAAIDTTPQMYQRALSAQKVPDWLTKFSDGPKAEKARQRWEALLEKQQLRLELLENNAGSYFARFEVYRSDNVMNEWRTDMVRTVRRLRRARRTLEVERSPSACAMPWSMKCEYSDLCLDRSDEHLRKALFSTQEERDAENESVDESNGEVDSRLGF